MEPLVALVVSTQTYITYFAGSWSVGRLVLGQLQDSNLQNHLKLQPPTLRSSWQD
jgi:hypothetical protein